jgi:hypothetical protein
MIETMHSVRCVHCGKPVDLRGADLSLSYVTREPVADDPRSFLIIAKTRDQDLLLHACTGSA